MYGWDADEKERFARRFDFDCPLCGGQRSITCIPIQSLVDRKIRLCVECENCRRQVYRTDLPMSATDEEIRKAQDEEVEYLVNYFRPELKWKVPNSNNVKELLPFSEALNLCINGKKISRRDWNGKGMFVYYVPAHTVKLEDWKGDIPLTDKEKECGEVSLAGHFDMYNAQGLRIIGWLASQTDMASNNWYVVE